MRRVLLSLWLLMAVRFINDTIIVFAVWPRIDNENESVKTKLQNDDYHYFENNDYKQWDYLNKLESLSMEIELFEYFNGSTTVLMFYKLLFSLKRVEFQINPKYDNIKVII